MAAAVVAAVAGGLVIAQSLAQVALARGDAQSAHGFAPWDGRTGGALAQALTLSSAAAGTLSPTTASRIAVLSRDAIARDATSVPAVTSLATTLRLQENMIQSDRLFAYSEQLSRRDLGTQLWAIEGAVARNDVPGALRHYDIALRTGARAPEILFPVLGNAVDEPEIRQALLATLDKQPPWRDAFVSYVAREGRDPLISAAFITTLAQRRIPVDSGARAQLTNVLAGRFAYEAAWTVYTGTSRRDRRTSRNPDFSDQVAAVSVFDWVPATLPGATVDIQREGTSGSFDFALTANAGGVLLEQMQLLPAGKYVIEGRSADIDQPDGARPYWSLRCHIDGRELGRVAIGNSNVGGGLYGGEIVVPADCAAQRLTLVAQGSDGVAGTSGRLLRAAVRPVAAEGAS